MKKQLLIAPCYLDTDVKRDILRTNLMNLKEYFDILVSSHLPVDAELQAHAKYVIYDSNNELNKKDGFSVWYACANVYQQWHYENSYNPSYAVYQLIRPAVLFAKSQGYESFIYLEGDTLLNEVDIPKLLELRTSAVSENKRALFFNGLQPWWDCQLFYSEIDFFVHNTPVLFSFAEFSDYCSKVGAHDYLESLLYRLFAPHAHQTKEIQSIVQNYIPNSLLNLTQVNEKYTNYNFHVSDKKDSSRYIQYIMSVMKLENTDRIFLSYRRVTKAAPNLDVYVDDELCLSIRTDQEFMYTEIFPNETFQLKLIQDGSVVKELTILKEDVLKNPDFIKFT